jgi:hypothetical protein
LFHHQSTTSPNYLFQGLVFWSSLYMKTNNVDETRFILLGYSFLKVIDLALCLSLILLWWCESIYF